MSRGSNIIDPISLCLRVSVVDLVCALQINKKPGAVEMVLQVRVPEYLLLINDIHGPRGAFQDNTSDRFRGLRNGL